MTYRTFIWAIAALYLVFGPRGWSTRTVAAILLADMWLLDIARDFYRSKVKPRKIRKK